MNQVTCDLELVMREPMIKLEPATIQSGGEIDTDDRVIKAEELDICDDECKPEFVDWRIKTEELDISDCEYNAGSDADDSRRVADDWNGAEAEKRSATEIPPLTTEPFDCNLCLATFPSKISLTEHVTGFCVTNQFVPGSKKVALSTKTFVCSCKVKFKDLMDLEVHVKNNHKKGCRIIRCTYCNKLFTDYSSRNQHLLTHMGSKKYECKVCQKGFNASSNRSKHLLTHIGGKKYECKFCPKQFSTSSNRNQHLLIHMGEKKHKCTFCPKRFTENSSRNKHLLIHTGEKNYECKYCQKRFSQISNRNKHLLTHKGRKKYDCKFCSKQFSQEGYRNKHLLTHKEQHVNSTAGAEPVNITESFPLSAES